MKKYVIHPGYVYSKTDKDRHYIGAFQLMKLYKVPLSECLIDHWGNPGGWPKEMIHLWPKYNGNYLL